MGILARSEVCQKCALCCKEFSIVGFEDQEGFKKRIDWLCDDKITMSDDYQLIINIPCAMLRYDGELYSCAVHENPLRPHLCQDYPDHVPVSAWENESKRCPILAEKLALLLRNDTKEEKQYEL